jgi:hypothetical protein
MTHFARLLCLASLPVFAQSTQLSFRPVAAEYSSALDRIIGVSGNPDRLQILNPATGATTAVPLEQAPLSLSVSPDGLFAAVGHQTAITYVSLSVPKVERVYAVTNAATAVALSPTWIYSLPANTNNAYSVNIQTGAVTSDSSTYFGNGLRYNVARPALYGVRDSYLYRYETTAGALSGFRQSGYLGDFCATGPAWLSPDGSRLYTGCGTVFRSSNELAHDMTYVSRLGEQQVQISALSESTSRGLIATVRTQGSYYNQSGDESFVYLYGNANFQATTRIPLVPFSVSGQSFRSIGRWVFFNTAGNALYAIVQAPTGSGLLNDFAVQQVGLGDPAACGATFDTASASAHSLGATVRVNVSASATCIFKPVADVPWIRITTPILAIGDTALDLAVTANPGSVARTGRVTIGAQAFTVNQDAPTAVTGLNVLGHDVIDAEYNRTINKLITISAIPPALYIWNPATRSEQTVALTAAPLSVSVRPDGRTAAVGHNRGVSYVNLETAVVDRFYDVATDVSRVALSASGYAYLFSSRASADIYSLNIATGAVTTTAAAYYGRIPRLHSNGRTMYVGGGSLSKWDISQGTAARVTGSNYYEGTCGNFWLTRDGHRLFGTCSRVLRTSDLPSEDLQLNGTLSDAPATVWADHSPERQLTAVIPNPNSYNYTGLGVSYFQVYNDAVLGMGGSAWFPSFAAGTEQFAALGRHVFWSSDGNTLYAVVQADRTSSPAAIGVAEIPYSAIATSVAITLQTVPAGLKVRVNNVLTSTPVTVNWPPGALRQLSGEPAQLVGNSVYNISSWSPGQSQSLNLVVGTTATTYTATYTATPCTYNLQQNSTTVNLAGQTVYVYLNTPDGCPWTYQSHTSWITSLQKYGNNYVTFVVPPYTGPTRTGTLTIAGQTFTITQQVSPPATLYYPSPNSRLSESNPYFYWQSSNDATNYRLDVGTTVGGTEIYSATTIGSGHQVIGLPTDGSTIRVRLWTFAGGEWQTPRDYSYLACSGCPATIAALTAPAAASTFTSSSVTFTWNAITGATNYWLDVGRTRGQGDIHGAATTSTTVTVAGIPTTGVPIYARIWTQIGGVWRAAPDVTYTSCSACSDPRATLTAPAQGTVLTSRTATFQWTAGTGATQYWLDVGTSAGSGNLFGRVVTGLSAQVTNLPNTGVPLYVGLWTYINGAWRSPLTYTMTSCNGCASQNVATLSAPAPGSVLTTRAVTFSWAAVTGASSYWLDVGTKVGDGSIAARSGTSTSHTITLPNDGRTLYIRLWTQMSGVWQTPNDYTVTACNGCADSPTAALISPAAGTVFNSQTAVFDWSPGTNVTQYWLDVGTSPGVGNIHAAGTTARGAQVVNLPSNGATLYVGLWSYINGAWQGPANYTFQACHGCPIETRGLLTSPAPGTVLTSKNVNFSWVPGTGATNYWLDIGNAVGDGSISARSSTQPTQTVALPNDGRTLYIRLWSYLNGAWRTPLDYRLTACSGC